jgi:hypothetical protein
MKKSNKQKLKEKILKAEDSLMSSYYNTFLYKKNSEQIRAFTSSYSMVKTDDLEQVTRVADFIIENLSSFKFLCKHKKYNRSAYHTPQGSHYRRQSLANQLLGNDNNQLVNNNKKNEKPFLKGLEIITRQTLLGLSFRVICLATRFNLSLQNYVYKNASDYFKIYLTSQLTDLELERKGKLFWHYQLKNATTDRYRKHCYKRVSKESLSNFLENRYDFSLPSSLEWFLIGHKLCSRSELNNFSTFGRFKSNEKYNLEEDISDLIERWKIASCNWQGFALIEEAILSSEREPYYLMGYAVEIREACSDNSKNAHWLSWRISNIESSIKSKLAFAKIKA